MTGLSCTWKAVEGAVLNLVVYVGVHEERVMS